MNIKNSEIIEKYTKINELLKKCSFKATVCLEIVRNKNLLKEIADSIEETRELILKNNAEKDENGEPVIQNGNYKFKDINKVTKEVQEFFNEETEIEFKKISIVDLGENDILGEYIDTLSDFIE